MLMQWFKRWLGMDSGAQEVIASPPVSVERPTNETAAPALGARRPLISKLGEVAGYEFQLGGQGRHKLGGGAGAAHTSALLMAVSHCAQGKRIGLAELPVAAFLALDEQTPLAAGTLLALQMNDTVPDASALNKAIRRCRAAGVKVGWRLGQAPSAEERADFLLLGQAGKPLESLLTSLRWHKSEQPQLPLIALELESIAALESALQAGADYAGCAMHSRNDPGGAGQIAPQAQRVLQLLNALVRDADTTEVAATIKADVSLSYRLLRYLNSASVGTGKEIGSIQQAVVLLGRDELYRWLSVLLVRVSAGRPVSSALQEVALARARLLELLAEARGEDRPGDFFTLGMSSMLGELLSTPLERAMESLNLPAAAHEALLQRSGPWAPYLAIAEAVEDPDGDGLETLAGPFGGVDAVLACSVRAWSFAADPDNA